MRSILLLTLLLFHYFSSAYHQINDADKDYFKSPLKIPLFLAGNFGELRGNHFHAGIDIKTQGRQGLSVHAAASGTISRIKVSPYGYGLALYIDHPNGYTTVYGHLRRYNNLISNYVRNIQYQKESFAVDIQVPKGTFDVKQGDVIAYSGNTGGSGGPHLHFEIRDTKSEHPVNPLMFNFDIKDNMPPRIKGLMIYPLSTNATVNGKHCQKPFKVTGGNGKYKLESGNNITANGTIGLGLYMQDFLDGSTNRCGIFENILRVNDEPIYTFCMDEFDFEDTKYANSYCDYAYQKKHHIRYQKSYVEANNRMNNFGILKRQGTFEIHDKDTTSVSYRISDVHGNISTLNFIIHGENIKECTAIQHDDNYVLWKNPYECSTPNAQASFSAGTFYTNLLLSCTERSGSKNTFSPIISIGNEYIPTHNSFKLKIKATNLPKHLQEKACIISLDENNKIESYLGGIFINGWVEAEANQLGNFAIGIDSISPSIRALSIDNDMSLNNQKQINFKVSDNLSGIRSWRGEIDGKWVLFEYEYKLNKLFYVFDGNRLTMNKEHSLKLEVNDELGNTTIYRASFYK
ncbi:MAG: M23 family metallopeptidase [Mangrovibacterium sp.]